METTNNIQAEAASKITLKEVNFQSNGITIAGVLRMSVAESSANNSFPAIVVGHPGTGVKEQTAGLYAKLLAEWGWITLTFDAAYQGESGGFPRGLEDPAQRVEDIRSAVSFLGTLPQVNPNAIGVLGICASGGYSIYAASVDERIKAIATVSAADISRQFRKGGDGKQNPEVFQYISELTAADRPAVANGEASSLLPLFPDNAEEAKAMGQHVYEGWEYYCTDRGQHPRSAKAFTLSSIDKIANFDAFEFAHRISPRPLLMIAGSDAVTMWMNEDAYEAANDPKELFVIDGASHVALYDKLQFVVPAVEKLANFFSSGLK
jgi:fermentation-respiration switch protein FrsA (DUF1100 family)